MSLQNNRGYLAYLLPVAVFLSILSIWFVVTHLVSVHGHWTLSLNEDNPPGKKLIEDFLLPTPKEVKNSYLEELNAGRINKDIASSLWRVAVGFGIAVIFGVPIGLMLGLRLYARIAFLPLINFFRSISPLAWLPFAILWFGIGDKGAIFLIFMSTFFTLILATLSAVANIPAVRFRVAKDYGYSGAALLAKVTLPAIMPQVISALRVTAGVAWIVVVACEMNGCQDGVGYAIWDSRQALRIDTTVCYMIVIGILGLIIDRVLAQLTKMPHVRWGYER